MIIKEIQNREEWNNFVAKQDYTLFVQYWEYGEFHQSMGEKFWVFGIYDNENNLIGGSLMVSVHAKRGNFIYLPYGPILPKNNISEVLNEFVVFLKDFTKKIGGYQFVRVSPFLEDNSENVSLFKSAGFKDAPMHMLAENTWILDIQKTEEELLQNMNKNHRNLIRRCIKDGVKIEKSEDQNYLKGFFNIYNETAKRHKFYKFPQEYITKEFESFAGKNRSLIFNAYLPDGTLDSSAIIMYADKMAAYRHGASLNTDKKIPTSYLIQWEAIKEAKKRGIKMYNFWGIAPENANKNHPFYGITHFKKGFGGEQKNLVHCQDLPLSSGYFINWIIETIRKIKRGF